MLEIDSDCPGESTCNDGWRRSRLDVHTLPCLFGVLRIGFGKSVATPAAVAARWTAKIADGVNPRNSISCTQNSVLWCEVRRPRRIGLPTPAAANVGSEASKSEKSTRNPVAGVGVDRTNV